MPFLHKLLTVSIFCNTSAIDAWLQTFVIGDIVLYTNSFESSVGQWHNAITDQHHYAILLFLTWILPSNFSNPIFPCWSCLYLFRHPDSSCQPTVVDEFLTVFSGNHNQRDEISKPVHVTLVHFLRWICFLCLRFSQLPHCFGVSTSLEYLSQTSYIKSKPCIEHRRRCRLSVSSPCYQPGKPLGRSYISNSACPQSHAFVVQWCSPMEDFGASPKQRIWVTTSAILLQIFWIFPLQFSVSNPLFGDPSRLR